MNNQRDSSTATPVRARTYPKRCLENLHKSSRGIPREITSRPEKELKNALSVQIFYFLEVMVASLNAIQFKDRSGMKIVP